MKKAKKKQKSLPALKKECERFFNEFIRLRDKNLPCISCGKFNVLQAGHYYAVSGYDGIRFEEHNVNGECAGCNCFNESHLIGYGENLPKKIGNKNFLALKEKARKYKQDGYKFSRSELIEKIEYYKLKVEELKCT